MVRTRPWTWFTISKQSTWFLGLRWFDAPLCNQGYAPWPSNRTDTTLFKKKPTIYTWIRQVHESPNL
jgi:hypothetical protein